MHPAEPRTERRLEAGDWVVATGPAATTARGLGKLTGGEYDPEDGALLDARVELAAGVRWVAPGSLRRVEPDEEVALAARALELGLVPEPRAAALGEKLARVRAGGGFVRTPGLLDAVWAALDDPLGAPGLVEWFERGGATLQVPTAAQPIPFPRPARTPPREPEYEPQSTFEGYFGLQQRRNGLASEPLRAELRARGVRTCEYAPVNPARASRGVRTCEYSPRHPVASRAVDAAPPDRPRIPPHEVALVLVASGLLGVGAARGAFAVDEVLGFVTGAACVWLLVHRHIANWPVGIASNAAFFYVFFRSRLYADMSLQLVYTALGVWGWIAWARKGAQGAHPVARASRLELAGLAVFVPLATLAMREVLLRVNGAAPVWDALTTALSLGAMVLMCRKRLENWLLWIVADVIYVPLYISRELPLTAALYLVFLLLCLGGLRAWSRELRGASA